MSKVNESIFQNFWKISKKVQNLQDQVQNQPVSSQVRETLHKQLESLQGSLELLRQKALQTQKQVIGQFDEMESQIITLYRKIEEKFEEYEITLISKEAMDLSNSLESGKMLKAAKQVNELRHNIHFLFTHRRPSMQHRKIVNIILKITEHAEGVLTGNSSASKEQVQLIHLLKMLLREAVLQAEKAIDPIEGELSMDLYEIADLLYRKKQNEARFKLNFIRSRLSSAQQARLNAVENNPHELLLALLEITD